MSDWTGSEAQRKKDRGVCPVPKPLPPRMRVMNVKGYKPHQLPGVIYCGRKWAGWEQSLLANPHSSHAVFCPECKKKGVWVRHTREESIELFRRDLWAWVKEGRKDVVEFLRSLPEDAVCGCWCINKAEPLEGPEQCHCEVIIKASRWLKLKEGKR